MGFIPKKVTLKKTYVQDKLLYYSYSGQVEMVWLKGKLYNLKVLKKWNPMNWRIHAYTHSTCLFEHLQTLACRRAKPTGFLMSLRRSTQERKWGCIMEKVWKTVLYTQYVFSFWLLSFIVSLDFHFQHRYEQTSSRIAGDQGVGLGIRRTRYNMGTRTGLTLAAFVFMSFRRKRWVL